VPKEEQDFRGVSLKRELVEQVEKFVKENPQYKSIADFVHEAVRVRMEELRKIPQLPPLPRFGHFNISDFGARITDTQSELMAEIYFKPEGVWCDLDKSSNCEHIKYALTVPKIQKIVRKHIKEGWKLPDV
jgi:hypothetical protein